MCNSLLLRSNIHKLYVCPTIEGWPITIEVLKKLAFVHTKRGWKYNYGPVWAYVVNAFKNPVEIEGIYYDRKDSE